MLKISPKFLGVFLFLVINSIIITAQFFPSVGHFIRPIGENVVTRTSMPRTTSRFGEILAKEYSMVEKKKIENVALAPNPTSQAVLGASSSATAIPLPTPTISIDKLEKFDPVSSESGTLTIALLGDSMIDTLQPSLPQLKVLLAQAYPNYTFNLFNFGVGASNIEQGLDRLTNEYDYLGSHHPSLLSTNPDIVVIESFAYNPWSNSQNDLDRQWSALVKIIDTVKSHLPKAKIVLSATIAPNSNTFGDGVLNWSKQDKKNKAITIRSYLQNMVNFASSTQLPLADAYHPSLTEDTEGDSRFISATDHIHPSGEGGYLFSHKLVEAIVKNKLIE